MDIEQKAEIERLEARVEELENEIRRLCAWAAKQKCISQELVTVGEGRYTDIIAYEDCGKCIPCEARAKEEQNESP